MSEDAFSQNLEGPAILIGDPTNKIKDTSDLEEGIASMYEDILDLPMSDEELLDLKREYESKSAAYYPRVKDRQERNKVYLNGRQRNFTNDNKIVPKNLLFEATATFVPATLAENPEPVVYSDNTDEGKAASNDLKTMLQYHAKTLGFRQKLGMMVWQWSEYFIGCVKYGWEPNEDKDGNDKGDITIELRKPQNLVLDPDGYVDEFGDFHGWVGDRIEKPASWFIEKFPKHATYIRLKVNDKLGTRITATEWWNDEYTFTTFQDQVLDKSKNVFFNYGDGEKTDSDGRLIPFANHFAKPKKPFTFFSVFSLQEEPYDFTNLIEQNIPNQDRINDRDEQITKNLTSGNNAVVLDGTVFTSETADQAVQTFYEDGFLLSPNGNMDAVKRIPASALPSGIMEAQESDMQSLRSVYGTSGLIPNTNPEEAVRNNLLNEQHDSSRIGGGVGDRIEITAENMFNWCAQLYAVNYDIPHYGAVMGNAAAVEYVSLTSQNMERKFVITVAPNSMAPKDEVSERQQAIQMAEGKLLDPINLFKALDDSDPINTAKMVATWNVNPMAYLQQFFPEQMAQMQQAPQPSPIQPQPEQSQGSSPQPNSSPLSQVPLQKI